LFRQLHATLQPDGQKQEYRQPFVDGFRQAQIALQQAGGDTEQKEKYDGIHGDRSERDKTV
jgi:hypothetical protein